MAGARSNWFRVKSCLVFIPHPLLSLTFHFFVRPIKGNERKKGEDKKNGEEEKKEVEDKDRLVRTGMEQRGKRATRLIKKEKIRGKSFEKAIMLARTLYRSL